MITGWIIFGIILCALEFILPGAVVIFLGLGAFTTAAFVYFGIVDTGFSAILSWFISSIAYLIALRGVLMKFMPGDRQVQDTDEEAATAGKIVQVIETIKPEAPGRIRLQDTTWTAYASVPIEAGNNAIIVSQKGIGWLVKPLD